MFEFFTKACIYANSAPANYVGDSWVKPAIFSVIFFKEEQLMAVMHKIADVYGPNVNKDSFPASDGDELKKNPVAKVKEECTLGRSKFEFIFFDLVILKYIFKKFKKNT